MEWILAAALAVSVAGNVVLGGAVHFLIRAQDAMTRVLSAEFRRAAEGPGARARSWSLYKRRPEDDTNGG